MNLQWIGSALIILGCGGVGFLMAYQEKRELHSLLQLIKALEFMHAELCYHLTPLPELFRAASHQVSGAVNCLLRKMSGELDRQILPNASYCMTAALEQVPDLPRRSAAACRELGSVLGYFDLEGQRKGIESVIALCRRSCQELEQNRPQRLRSYQTLGLCAGAALVILLI